MKKVYTLLFTFLAVGMSSYAQEAGDQTFQFQYEDGTVVEDGATIWLSEVTESETGESQIETGLYIKNTTNEKAAGRMEADLTNMPNGEFACCAFGNCMRTSVAAVQTFSKKIVEAGAVEDIMTEWIPVEDGYATWTSTFQIQVLNITTDMFGNEKAGNDVIALGSKITVNFQYVPTGIKDVDVDGNAEVVARYSSNGQQLNAPAKGVNILKLSNGKTIKQIVK